MRLACDECQYLNIDTNIALVPAYLTTSRRRQSSIFVFHFTTNLNKFKRKSAVRVGRDICNLCAGFQSHCTCPGLLSRSLSPSHPFLSIEIRHVGFKKFSGISSWRTRGGGGRGCVCWMAEDFPKLYLSQIYFNPSSCTQRFLLNEVWH